MARNLQLTSSKDIIVAPATAPGAAAIAIVRVSGAGARDVAQKVFSQPLTQVSPGQLKLGRLIAADGAGIDQVLCAWWKAPRSFTGEDMAEFHLHGSPAVVSAALAALQGAGARLAEPGEFTRRAYLNGKLDLTQAEAVADLTQSQTDEARRAALNQLGGGLSKILGGLRRDLVQVTAELEATVDYPEEEIPSLDRDRLGGLVDSARRQIGELLESCVRGKRLKDGARVVFAGPPNAGKSSLFNVLHRRERAIVTPHAGTTRDVIEAVVDLKGIPVTLLDTAGLRPDPEEVEAIGIERSREEIRSADLVLFVVDAGSNPETALQEYNALRDAPHVVLFNKSESLSEADREHLGHRFRGNGRRGVLFVSATARQGIDAFEQILIEQLGGRESSGGTVVTSGRHEAALRKAEAALETVGEGLATGLSPEFVVVDLQVALSEIDTITGRQQLDEEVLDLIFSTFCLGK